MRPVVARRRPAYRLLALLVLGGGAEDALAQGRAACEAGIAEAKQRLLHTADAGERAELSRAIRIGERELGEQEYDECLEALEDAGIGIAATSPAPGKRTGTPEADERVGADPGLPVSVEDAFVPSPGEIEATLSFGYDRLRRVVRESDDADGEEAGGHAGRHLYMPGAEIEIGLARGLSASVGTAYSFGNAPDAQSGEIEIGTKWNFLPLRGLGPALALSAQAALPYGAAAGGSKETTLSLLGSQPLGSGGDAPFLHVNLGWIHAFQRDEAEDRANRLRAVLGIAVPLASSTALFADILREQRDEKARIDQLIELGLRQALPRGITLGAGIGVGIGNSETDFRALFGLQKTF